MNVRERGFELAHYPVPVHSTHRSSANPNVLRTKFSAKHGSDSVTMVTLTELRATCPQIVWLGESNVCQICANPLPTNSRRQVYCSDKCRRWFERNHVWRYARIAARRRAKYCCSRQGCDMVRADGIEVNHIVPLRGRGYGPSCFHHQTNLETLCHAHHVEVTRFQRLTL